jgi:hypothetical protein
MENLPQQPNKQQQWQEMKDKMDSMADAAGAGIEEGIKDTVIFLNLLGFNTYQSCEGHVYAGRVAPWIDFEAPNKPEWYFNKQKEIYEEYSKRLNIPVEDFKYHKMMKISKEHLAAFLEATKLVGESGESPEYLAWESENHKYFDLVKNLVEEFYTTRHEEVPKNVQLVVDRGSSGQAIELHNGGDDYELLDRIDTSVVPPDEEIEKLSGRLKSYQAEMQIFTEFLKNKYFSV